MIQLKCTYISALSKKRFLIVQKIGVIKEIDNLGRLQIPIEIRKRLGLSNSVQLIITDEGLLIKSEEYKLIKLEPEEK